ncbi:Cytochrome-c oxidase [Isosphaera pallida ATCC 43644]|uniref:Cytochrome-c oxidase n=1 Tax=Isosphaera pallida (strain ATCC 43644 / DSM 9630 / IS1B) TaxID=575540 RepID=E8R2V8_ISOPI|nr:cytochrome c oxidase subunit 3 [Isosphaera pallida]ADV61462.1 Cytochrome-c oxidase [Isosphaera pallida ATCC 43644]
MADAALNPAVLAGAAVPTGHAASTSPFQFKMAPKVAMWLFLGTEVMFFTGLIGSYLVLRAGSPATAYSAVYPPNAAPAVAKANVDDPIYGFTSWPRPYDSATNPLNIPMTWANTLILMSSSVTLSLAIMAIQRGKRAQFLTLLVATLLLGSTFLGIQIFEYYELMFPHEPYPIGVSPTGAFTPDVSLFASAFFVMTGFHGMHVFAGAILLLWITTRAFLGYYTKDNHISVEIAALYWHFVDLVWIVLFTVVYLI